MFAGQSKQRHGGRIAPSSQPQSSSKQAKKPSWMGVRTKGPGKQSVPRTLIRNPTTAAPQAHARGKEHGQKRPSVAARKAGRGTA